ncbi:MAG: hypothetical protein AAF787_12055 [Chloroflexota bacterium]
MTAHTLPRPAFMRHVLAANVAFSVTFAVLFTFVAGAVANFTDVAWQPYYRALGVGLFAFGAFVFYTRQTLNPRLIWTVFALDVAWVVGSYVLLVLNLLPVTTAAKWAFAGIADAVLVFAILEWWGMRR